MHRSNWDTYCEGMGLRLLNMQADGKFETIGGALDTSAVATGK